ncbi:MAG: hypothetical protein RL705_1146, partial [Bacteroidota bacterium]
KTIDLYGVEKIKIVLIKTQIFGNG